MKFLIKTAVLSSVLCLSLLTSCAGNTPSPEKSETYEIICTQSINSEENSSSPVLLTTQYPVYDKSCTYISIEITNRDSKSLEFGLEWRIEKHTGSGYKKMEFIDNFCWEMPLIILMQDGTYIQNCTLECFKEPLSDGEYRIIKELNGTLYSAEFTIGASPVTAEAPHGFHPLSELSPEYSTEDAIRDGVVVLFSDRIKNSERITEFIRLATIPNRRDQLRIAEVNNDGSFIIADVILQTDGRIDYISTRTDATEYYKFFTTDGENIYLSNSTTPDPLNDRKLFHGDLPLHTEAIQLVSELNSYSELTICAFSPDGVVSASTTGGTDIAFNAKGWGLMWSLMSENNEDGMNIIKIIWKDNEICRVIAQTTDGRYYFEDIYVDRESMKNINVADYGFSSDLSALAE